MANEAELKTVEIRANGVQANNTIKELAHATRTLKKELKSLDPTSKEFIEGSKRLREVGDRIGVLTSGVDKSAKAWGEFKKQASGVMAGVLGGSILTTAITGITSFFTKGITGAAKLSDELSNIAKVTSLTNQELQELNKEISELSTRTDKTKLRELAVQAGKLGIDGKRNILEFVKAADQIQVALGEDLGNDALIAVGKLVNVFKIKEEFGLEKGMLKVASAINSAGQASEASERNIVDFLNQVGGTGQTVGISIDDLVGLGAAFDSVGLSAEVSATAFKDNIIEFVRDTEKWAKIAGYNAGELTEILKSQGTNEAFLQFIQKLEEGTGSQTEFLNKLKELKIDGARGANVFLTIADNIGRVRDQQDLANKAFKEGTSISDEAAKKQANTAAVYEKFGKIFNSFLLNNPLSKAIQQLVEGTARLVVGTELLSKATEQEVLDLSTLELELYDVNKPAAERLKLIEELKKRYPEYLGNIDTETVSNEQLSVALQQINSDLINRIVIQKALEGQQEKEQSIAEKKLKVLKDEHELRMFMAKQAANQGFKVKPTGTVQGDFDSFNQQFDYSKAPGAISKEKVQTDLDNIKALKNQINEETKSLLNLKNEAKRIAAELGVDYSSGDKISGSAGGKTTGSKPTGKSSSTSVVTKTEDQIKAEEEALKKGQKLQEEYLKNTKKLIEDLKKTKIEAIEDEEKQEIASLEFAATLRKQEIYDTLADANVKADLIKATEEQLIADIAKVRKEYQAEIAKTEYDQAVKSVNNNYAQQRIMLAKNHIAGLSSNAQYNDQLAQLDISYLEQKLTIAKDYGMETLALEQQILEGKIEFTQQDLDNFNNALAQKQNAEEAAAKLRIISSTEGTKERMDAELALLQLQMERELELVGITEEEKALIRAEYQEQENMIREEQFNSELQRTEQLTSMSLDIYKKSIDALAAKETKEAKKTQKEKINLLNQQLERGLLSEDEYKNRKMAIDNEYNNHRKEIARAQWKAKKDAALVEAHINTAIAVTRAFVDYSWPYSLIVGAMMTAAGLVQYNAINNEPEPEFRLGTRLVGPSHEDGGIGIYGKGKYYGEAEGDELIMTKGVYRDPVGRRLASDLNAAFGGVRFDGYNSTSTPPRFSFGSIISGGGYTSTRTDTVMVEQRMAMQEEYMRIMAGEIKAIKETPLQAAISYDLYKQQMDAVDIARNR